MAIHDNFADLAIRLIRKNGRAITIRSKSHTINPAQPWKITATATSDQTETAVFFDNAFSDLEVALVQALGSPEGARTALERKGSRVWIPARDLVSPVVAKDVIVDGSNTWEISDVELIGPGPTNVVYICTVGR